MTAVAEATTRNIGKLVARRGSAISVTEDMELQSDLGLSSLNVIWLLTTLCNELDINIYALSDLDVAKMHQVKDIVQILEAITERRSTGGGAAM
jgi:acyl carrier protein